MNAGDSQRLLVGFGGRISRSKYWIGIAAIVLMFAMLETLGTVLDSPVASPVVGILVLGLAWPLFAVHSKRWHDRAKSGWWTGVAFFPIIGGVWVLVECGLLRGDTAANEYGPSPLPQSSVLRSAPTSATTGNPGYVYVQRHDTKHLRGVETQQHVAERAQQLIAQSGLSWTDAWSQAESEIGPVSRNRGSMGCLVLVWIGGIVGTAYAAIGIAYIESGGSNLGGLVVAAQVLWSIPLLITAIGLTVMARRARR